MFVVYHIASTHRVGPLPRSGRPHSMYAKTYKTAHMARRACERFNAVAMINRPFSTWSEGGPEVYGPGPYGWCTEEHHATRVRRMVTRVNLMSGKEYQEASDTPGYCSPSSEAYWSM